MRTRVYTRRRGVRRRAAPPLDGAAQAGRRDPAGAAPLRFLPPGARDAGQRRVHQLRARGPAAVQKLKAGLDAAGITTWFDMDRLEGGDDYDRKIQRTSRAAPTSSRSSPRRRSAGSRASSAASGATRVDRTRNMADGAVFILPVCIDDTDRRPRAVPEKFKAVHFTRLPGGEPTPEFVPPPAGAAVQPRRGARERRRHAGRRRPTRRRRRAAPLARPRLVHRGDARLLPRPRGGGRRARPPRAAQAAHHPLRPVGPGQDLDPARRHRAAAAARGLLPGLRAHRLRAGVAAAGRADQAGDLPRDRRGRASGRRPASPSRASRCGSSCTTATTC